MNSSLPSSRATSGAFDPARFNRPLIALESKSACSSELSATSRVPDAPPSSNFLAVMLTRKCNISCGHCSVESGPRVKGEPSEQEVKDRVFAAMESGVRGFLLTGGEPMLREKLVFELLNEIQARGLLAAMTSNGFWGRSPERARETVSRLAQVGLGLLTISYDRYHAAFQGPEPALHIARAASEIGLSININITRTSDDADLGDIVAPFRDLNGVALRFYDVQPIGRARDLEIEAMRANVEGFCNAAGAPALTDDGRITACNGPSYFCSPQSPLIMGNLSDEPMDVLLRRHASDPILDAIRTHGPAFLRDELAQDPRWRGWAQKPASGMCDLCLRLTAEPEAVAVLRERLSHPKLVAERAARQIVIAGARRSQELSPVGANGVGAARVWWRMAREPHGDWIADSERVLGRADLNWARQSRYLRSCGLSGALLLALSRPEVARWTPSFFAEEIQRSAMSGGLRSLLVREAMRRVAEALRAENASGVLLKGGALIALNDENAFQNALAPRSLSDLDVVIAPEVAGRVWARLRASGFDGPQRSSEQLAERGRWPQLDALSFEGIGVEVHHQVMDCAWALPERELLATARPLRAPELEGLRVMSAEAMLLHGGMHLAKHCFADGLKFAWDAALLIENTPDFDWEQVARWLRGSWRSRAFWAGFCVLARDLNLSVPTEFAALAPDDRRQKRLETLAARHLYDPVRRDTDMSEMTSLVIRLMQSDKPRHRVRYYAARALSKKFHQARRELAI